jgi:predicted dehydrogenase
MKVCFFGLGSIGERHLINLKKMSKFFDLELTIHSFRSSERKIDATIESLINKQIHDRNDLEFYDLIFITNPTVFHYEEIKNNIKNCHSMFIEKPLFNSIKYDLSGLNLKKDSIYYVACPLRYTPVVEYLKTFVNNHKIFSGRCICSSYLPKWRNGTDYRKVYSAKKELGGGVSLDLIHEIDYITYLFGFPVKLNSVSRKYSNLEIDSDDLSVYFIEYQDKLIELHLDYFGQFNQRKIEIYTEDDVIIGDLITNKITFLKSGNELIFKDKDKYINEMKYFLEHFLNGKKTFNEINHAFKILKISQGAII